MNQNTDDGNAKIPDDFNNTDYGGLLAKALSLTEDIQDHTEIMESEFKENIDSILLLKKVIEEAERRKAVQEIINRKD